jgi:PKD repeat protein
MISKKYFALSFIFLFIFCSGFICGQTDPVLTGIEGTALTYSEGEAAKIITSAITVTDPDGSLDSAIIRITTNYQNSEDRLSYTGFFPPITGVFNITTGILKLTGHTTPANYQAALRSVRYQNLNTDNPSELQRTVTFTVHDGINYSDTLSRDITVTRVNDAPVLLATEPAAVGYTENAAPVTVTSVIDITDVDDTNMESAVIQITGNYQSAEDVLSFTSGGGISGGWDSGSGILALSGSATIASYVTALRSVKYQNTSENPVTLQRTVSFTVNDSDDDSNTRTRNITITAVNDDPVLSGIEATPLGYTEGSGPVYITSTVAVTDVDNANMNYANIQITGNYANGEDILSFTNMYSITSTWYSNQGRLRLNGTDTKEHYQEALRTVRYTNTDTEDPSLLTRTVTFIITDASSATSSPVTRDITINADNDPPVLAGIEATPVTYTEEGSPVLLTSNITVTDVDDINIESASVQLTTNYLNTEDQLNFTNTANITGTWYVSTGILELNGTDTKANYQAALRSIRYVNTNTAKPSTLQRTVTFTVNDGDINSNTVTRNITVVGVNDLPVLSGLETAPLAYTEDQGPLNVTNTIVITDIDNDSLASATVRITGNYLIAEDTLVFTNTPGITGTWTDGTGLMTLTGPDTKANFQAALRSVSYINTNTGNPSLVVRTLTFRVYDGAGNSSPLTRNITITRINDAPTLSGIELTPLNYTEGAGAVPITATILVTDPDDSNIESATIQITGNYKNTEDTLVFTNTAYITSSWDQFTGTLTLNGSTTKANYQTALRNVRYKNKNILNITPLTRTVTFIINDGDVISNMVSRNISIIEENDPPVASNVNISGSHTIYSYLNGIYSYSDPESDPEGNSTYTWYRSAYPDGTDSVLIAGAVNKNYTTRFIDGGNYLSFGVKPADNKGAISPVIYNSGWQYINAGPTAQNLHIGGAKALGQIDTADFEYFDVEADPEYPAGHYYQWYRANNISGGGKMAIPGATNKTYLITNNDNHKYISVEVSLAASAGSLRGDTAQSIWYGPISQLPSVTITGTDTICIGQFADITFSYIGENPPWAVTYKVNGTDEYTISNIFIDETTILSDVPGIYELVSVSDNHYNDVPLTGSITISNYEPATVHLTGIQTDICDDGISTGILSANFTGEAPWNFALDRPSGISDTIYTNVTQDPFIFNVRRAGRYRIIALSDKNCNGDTIGSGSVVIKYLASPHATISGTDTICPGDIAPITVTLDKGTVPWRFTYTIDGINPATITGITQTTYTLQGLIGGLYELTGVEDAICTGRTEGSAHVYYRSLPTAHLSGGGAMCEGTATNIIVTLTGTSPWNFTYRELTPVSDTSLPVNNVLTSPRMVPINPDTTAQYTLIEMHDKYCPGIVSGVVNVSVIPAPKVTLLGLQQTYSLSDDWVPIFGDPEDGYFSGPGIILYNDTMRFIPAVAGITEEDDPPHKIIYSYQDPVSGCYGRDTAEVFVLEKTASIRFPNNKKFYCYNSNPFTIQGVNVFNDTGTFIIEGGIGLVDKGNNTAVVYPDSLLEGNFDVTYYKSNGTSFEVTDEFEVQYVDEVFIIGFTDHTYCSNDPNVKLNGNIPQGIFYGSSVTGNPASGFYFVPSIAPIGLDTIYYSYTTSQGCSRVTFDTAVIDKSPEIGFLVDDVCLAVGTGDTTVFTNTTTSTDPVTSWLWNFGDPNSATNNTSTLKDPTHVYTSSGLKQVTLTAATGKGCLATEATLINFGDIPEADFTWGNECFNDGIPIKFTNTSTCNQGNITSTKWKFYSDGTYSISFNNNPLIKYSKYGNYNVELIVKTEYGCADTVLKTLHLRRTISIEDGGYFEDFEQGVAGWYSYHDKNESFTTNSWIYGEPGQGFSGAYSGASAWYTNIETSPAPDEKSWVTGPCFDFRGTKRPMIKLGIWRLFDQARDAAVLQYTDDNHATWHNVGDYLDGINWFNEFNIPVKPGDNSVGWSKIIDGSWREARHELDNLKGKTNVQFRIAYASDGTAINNDGIAFDDIWIGERKKTVLLEHFTNTGDINCKDADITINNLVNNSNDVVDLQYHTSFPEGDPFYLHNTAANGTREAYYGISSIPYTLMDGGINSAYKFDYDFKELEQIAVDTQALKDPRFELLLHTENTGSSINIECTLTALENIPQSYLTLYIAVIEREITQITEENEEEIYESVVKTILPNPSGTSYIKSWTSGEQETVNYSWTFTNVFDADQVRVVAFIQNETTGEIYQSAIDIRDYLSSIYDAKYVGQEMKVLVFPNPANGIAWVKFNQPLHKKYRLELYDNMGKLVYSRWMQGGDDLYHFRTDNFNKGLYILRIADNKAVIDVKKLIIE